jgi:hypothetical protein
VKIGMNGGWDAAAKRCYGMANVTELEQAWIDWLRTRTLKLPPVPPDLPQVPPAPPNSTPDKQDPLSIPASPTSTLPIPPPPTISVDGPSSQRAVEPPPPMPAVPIGTRASAPAPAPPPKLSVVQVWMDKDGGIECRFAKIVNHEATATAGTGPTGKPITTYVRRTVQEERSYSPEQLVIVGADGKQIDKADLAKRLEKETAAIFDTEGVFELALLPLLKEGTLIIQMNPGPPPPLPPASHVP